VELGLHLRAEQPTVGGPERQQIDPAPAAAATDFDLVAHLPPKCGEVAADIPAAPRVNAVLLAPPIGKPRQPGVKRRPHSQLANDPVGERQVEVTRVARLESRDHRLAATCSPRELALAPAEPHADVSDDTRDLNSDRVEL
jgi:hypothetical protein